MKTQHQLFLAKSPQEFASLVDQAGVSLEDLLSTIPLNGTRSSLVLTGSIPQGLGTAESDVDFMLLTTQALSLPVDHGQWSYSRGAGLDRTSLKIYRQGIEFNLELISSERLQALEAAVGQLVSFGQTGRVADRLPLLEEADLKLLHQLRTAWALRDEDVLIEWRQRFGTSLLALYMAINNFVLLNEYIEDVESHRASDVPGGALLHRTRCSRVRRQDGAGTCKGNQSQRQVDGTPAASCDQGRFSPFAAGVQGSGAGVSPLSAESAIVARYIDDLATLRSQLEAIMKRDAKMAKLLQVFETNVHYIGVH